MDVIGGIVLVTGALFVLLAAIGTLRFDEVYARMHAAAKGPALGVLLTGIGTALIIRSVQSMAAVILVIVLQLLTGSIGSHMLGRSVYRAMRPPLDGPDELDQREHHT